MDERGLQIRRAHVWAIVVASALVEAEDMDLWLEAQNLASRAVMGARAKRANAAEPHEDGQGHEQ